MISQQIDLVAGDFNGTAWRCRSRNNISAIDESLRHRALHHCGDPDQFRTTGLTSVDFLNRQAPIDIGRCACTVHSPSHEELLACDQLIKVAIMRHGSIWTSSTGATLGNRKVNTVDTFPLKNVLRHVIMGNRKDASHERPFAFLVTVRPFAHVVQHFAKHVHPYEVT